MAEGNGNGEVRERVAKFEGERDRVPLGHILTALGIALVMLGYIESRINALDTALQREARDLDHALEIQIGQVKEVTDTNNERFISFIYQIREWQLEAIEKEAFHRGQVSARLDALESEGL